MSNHINGEIITQTELMNYFLYCTVLLEKIDRMEGDPLRPMVPSLRNRLLHVPYSDAGPGHRAGAQLAKD